VSTVVASRPSTRRRTAVWVGVLAVVAAAVLGWLVAGRSTPLEARGGFTLAGAGIQPPLPFAGAVLRPLRYADRQEVQYTLDLHNGGPTGVTVTGVAGPPDGTRVLLRPVAVLADGSDAAPFRIGRGDTRQRVVRMQYVDCEVISSRSSTVIDSVTVRFRVLGVPRKQTFPLPERLRIGSPRDAGCPRSRAETRPPG